MDSKIQRFERWREKQKTYVLYANIVVKTWKCHEQRCRLNQYGISILHDVCSPYISATVLVGRFTTSATYENVLKLDWRAIATIAHAIKIISFLLSSAMIYDDLRDDCRWSARRLGIYENYMLYFGICDYLWRHFVNYKTFIFRWI